MEDARCFAAAPKPIVCAPGLMMYSSPPSKPTTPPPQVAHATRQTQPRATGSGRSSRPHPTCVQRHSTILNPPHPVAAGLAGLSRGVGPSPRATQGCSRKAPSPTRTEQPGAASTTAGTPPVRPALRLVMFKRGPGQRSRPCWVPLTASTGYDTSRGEILRRKTP